MVQKGDSDSKHRDSRFGNRLGLGIGLEIQSCLSKLSRSRTRLENQKLLVSDSESGLENWDSGNSDPGTDWRGLALIGAPKKTC